MKVRCIFYGNQLRRGRNYSYAGGLEFVDQGNWFLVSCFGGDEGVIALLLVWGFEVLLFHFRNLNFEFFLLNLVLDLGNWDFKNYSGD